MLFRVFLFVLAVSAEEDQFENWAVEPKNGLSMSIHNHRYPYTWIRERSSASDHKVNFENNLETSERGIWTMMLQHNTDADYDRWIIKSTNTVYRLACNKNAGLYAVPDNVNDEQIWKVIPVEMDGEMFFHIEVAEGEMKGYRIAMTGDEAGGCIPPPTHCNGKRDDCAHMNVGDGDCDHDDECFGNLVCGTSNCGDFPQQIGQTEDDAAEWDCCKNPDSNNPIFNDLWRFTDVFSSEGAYNQAYKITNRGACTISLSITEIFGYSKSYENSIATSLDMGYELSTSMKVAVAGNGFQESMKLNLNQQISEAVDKAVKQDYEIKTESTFEIEPHRCMVLKQFRVHSTDEISTTGVTFYSKEFEWGYCEASGDLGEDDDDSVCPPNAIDIGVHGDISNTGGYDGLVVEGDNGISSSSAMAFTQEAQAQEPLSASRVVLGGLAAFGLGVTLYGAAMHYMKQEAGHAYSEC